MKFSTKAEYGLRAIVHLANSDKPVSLASIAKKEQLSLPYLERIFSLLKKSDIVLSEKGVKGGYKLTKPAQDVPVGQVIEALEGKLYHSHCQGCQLSNCKIHSVWDKLYKQIHSTLYSITLKDLVK